VRLKEMRNQLFETVERGVRPLGYAHRAGTQSFYKGTSFGRLSLHLAIMNHPPEFDVAAHVAVRFDELEDLLNQFRNDLTEAEKRNTFSLGAELGNIAGLGYTKLGTVGKAGDIEPVADCVMTAFQAVGLPYLERFSNLDTALEAFSTDDRASWLVNALDGERAKNAVGLAYLLGRREKFFELAVAKTQFLTSRREKALDVSPSFAIQSLTDLESFLKLRDELIRRIELQDQTQAQTIDREWSVEPRKKA
jgi:hypothetical protein